MNICFVFQGTELYAEINSYFQCDMVYVKLFKYLNVVTFKIW